MLLEVPHHDDLIIRTCDQLLHVGIEFHLSDGAPLAFIRFDVLRKI